MKPIIYILIFFSSFLLYSQQCGWQWYSPYPQGNPINDISFVDSLNGIALGNYGTILKTTNGGIDWLIKPSGTTMPLTGLSFLNSTHAWAVGYSQVVGFLTYNTTILKSTNSGNSWSILSVIPNRTLTDIFFVNNNIGWAVGCTIKGWVNDTAGFIYKTTNGGTSWIQQVSGVNQPLKSVFFINADTGWVVGWNGTIRKTTNGGTIWSTQISPSNYVLYDIYFINSNVGWACGYNYILKTTDGGSNWTILNNTGGFLAFKIRALNSNIIMCPGDIGKVYTTTNGGLNWNVRYLSKRFELYSLFIKDSLTAYVTGESGCILKTINGGLTWTTRNCLSADQLWKVKFFNKNNGIIGTFQNSLIDTSHIFHSSNDGFNWSDSLYRYTGSFPRYDFATPNTGWLGTSDGILGKTTNGGHSWVVQSIGSTATIRKIQCIDTNICFLVGDNGTIRKTTNGGINWIALNAGTTNLLEGVYFLNTNLGWIGGDFGLLKKTTDGGTTWVTQTSGTSNLILDIFFINSNIGWICTISNEILKTTNGGITWTLQTTASTTQLYDIFFIDNNHGWSCGTEGTILKTTNGGTNWITQNTGSGNHMFTIYANDTTDVWAVDVCGGILHYTYYVQKPVLISPPNKDTLPLHTLQLKWHSTQYAVSYTVQVATDSNFTSNLWTQTVQTDTTTLFPILNYNTTYYWRVQGTDTASYTSLWSEIWHFKTGEQAIQLIPLVPTWNMISSYINPADTNFANIMSQLGTNLLIAKDGLGNVYWNDWGIDDIQSWNIYNGYQLYVIAADTLTMTGTLLSSTESPNSMSTGWYLISYLRDSILAPTAALQSIQNNFIILKDGDGNVYWPEWGIDDIINMQPGKGYQIYMNQEGVLIYPD